MTKSNDGRVCTCGHSWESHIWAMTYKKKKCMICDCNNFSDKEKLGFSCLRFGVTHKKLVKDFMRKNKGKFMTAKEIGESIVSTPWTVRKWLNHYIREGKIVVDRSGSSKGYKVKYCWKVKK